MQLFVSNRMEILSANLAHHLMETPRDPFVPELVLVQSRGMERWLSMELARWTGISANIEYLFPSALLFRVLERVVTVPDEPVFDQGTLNWSSFSILKDLPEDPLFRDVAGYLEDGDTVKRFQLAAQMADLFDQYLLFRPEMMREWEEVAADDWQGRVWKAITDLKRGPHRVHLVEEVKARIENGEDITPLLPKRISVFGISALPPFYIDFLMTLSDLIDVRWYQLNPCRHYWFDIKSEGLIEKKKAEAASRGEEGDDLHFEKGNPLLSSFGKAGKEFLALIHETEPEIAETYMESEGDTLLATLQNQILDLEDGSLLGDDAIPVAKNDASIEIHRCHGAMRELEVLRDRILHLFETDASVKPRDILVMAPDITTYAPYIEAVFGRPLSDGRRIPFSIADRSVFSESRIAETFQNVLSLADSRFTATSVLELLETPAVRESFRIEEDELETLRGWVQEARIRWGIDEDFRKKSGAPGTFTNTWRAGLERMVLAAALDPATDAMPGGMLPLPGIGPSAADLLSRFLAFTDLLFDFEWLCRRPKTPEAWCGILAELVTGLFAETNETHRETEVLRRGIDKIRRETRIAEVTESVPLSVVRSRMKRILDSDGFGGGFLGGAITFCAMVPMRCIPFDVIVLLGMNDRDYPRQGRQPGFDLMGKQPRIGDRTRRDDDRYLFLEILLSARKKLVVTWTGRSAEDDTDIPPSVLVSDLVDYLDAAFFPEWREGVLSESLVAKAPLQPFSPGLFDGEAPASFSKVQFEVARALVEGRETARIPFVDAVLEELEEDGALDLVDMNDFFRNPSRWFLSRRLGITLERDADILEDRDLFVADGLVAYSIRSAICEAERDGRDADHAMKRLLAEGRIPFGTPGILAAEGLAEEGRVLAKAVKAVSPKSGTAPELIRLEEGGEKIVGFVEPEGPEGRIFWRPGRLRAEDLVSAWIPHLVKAALGSPVKTTLLGVKQDKEMGTVLDHKMFPEPASVAGARVHLAELVGLYKAARTAPVPFFPEISMEWVVKMNRGKRPGPEAALKRVTQMWEDPKTFREEPGRAARLVYRDQPLPVGDDFTRTSETVFLPILKATGDIA